MTTEPGGSGRRLVAILAADIAGDLRITDLARLENLVREAKGE